MATQLILALTILVFVHEGGHFLAAKWFKMRVDRFFIFFDPWFRLWGKKIGETLYGIGWLPLGGYVKIAGMVDESLDTEQLEKEPEPWEFRAKPAGQRFIVMVAGVTMNIILGILIFIGITYYYGSQYLPVSELNRNGIVAKELGEKAGLQTGDKILAVNGKKVERFSEIQAGVVSLDKEKSTVLTIEREGERKQITIPPDFTSQIIDAGMRGWQQKFIMPRKTFTIRRVVKGSPAEKAGLQAGDSIVSIEDQSIKYFHEAASLIQENKGQSISLKVARNGSLQSLTAQVNKKGNLGFIADPNIKREKKSYGFLTSVKRGNAKAWGSLYANIAGLGKILSGDISAQKAVEGPIGIARVYGSSWNWQRFWFWTGLLSMWLAFINIIPIPALDGGHVMFILYEMISGRKPSQRFVEVTQMAGMIFLLALMAFVIGNDIWKLFN